jgi:hypothetical protein
MKYHLKKSLMVYLAVVLLCMIIHGCDKSSTDPNTNPDPQENLLPGVSYMGYGYNIFGEYARAEYVKSPLLKYDDYQTVTVKSQAYYIPVDVQYTSVNTADFTSVSGLNSYEYRESLGIKASLGASTPAFRFSITNIFSEEQYRSNYRAFCTIQNIIRKWKLTLPYTDLVKLRSMLRDDARNDLANLAPDVLFNKYGTHFITELLIGARADYHTSVVKSQATSIIKNNFQVCAEASFKKGTGSGSYNIVTEQELQTFESNSFKSTKVSGGRSEYGSYIFQTGNYDLWIESIDNIENLTIADFTEHSLLPIWELAATDGRRNELAAAFTTYSEQFQLPSIVDQAIDGLYFEVVSNPPVTPQVGWELINVDLNRDAGGAYIYLCYHNGPDDLEAISDITFIVNNQPVPAGYIKIDQDLNQGAGGDYIYLCYKKEITSTPIRRVNILIGQSATPDPDFYFGENYYTGVKQDLNQGAGGNYIWLVYSHLLPDPW